MIAGGDPNRVTVLNGGRTGRCARALAILGLLSLASVPFSLQPARAELLVCNQSLDVLNIALGFSEGGDFHTEGWWSVGANRCSSVVKEPLSSRYYYLYAEDVFGQGVLTGAIPACVDEKRFSVVGVADCWLRGLREVPFAEVDTQSQFRWTVLLKGQN